MDPHMVRIRHRIATLRDGALPVDAVGHDLGRAGPRIHRVPEQGRELLAIPADFLQRVEVVGEAATAADAGDGGGVGFGGFVEEGAEGGRGGGGGGGGGAHGGAEGGDFGEDGLDDVDAAFVEGAHGDGFPGWRVVAEVEEGGELDDELVSRLGAAAVEFEEGAAE